MSTVVSRRRGTAAQVAAVAGAVGEILPDMTSMRLVLGDGATLGGFPQAAIADITGRNLLINPTFSINQRGYASGAALAAGAYAHDRWRDATGASGTAYTFTQGSTAENGSSAAIDTPITITAGVLQQVVEARSIVGGNYVLSWSGTAQATIKFFNNGGFTTAASGSSPLICGLPAGDTVYVQFGPGTLTMVLPPQLEMALPYANRALPTRFDRRLPSVELMLCQRYYQLASYLYGFVNAANIIVLNWTPIVPMRAIPTLTLLTTAPYIESPPFSAAYNGSGSAIAAAHNSSGYTQAGVGFDLQVNGFSGLTSGAPAGFKAGQLAFSAEL